MCDKCHEEKCCCEKRISVAGKKGDQGPRGPIGVGMRWFDMPMHRIVNGVDNPSYTAVSYMIFPGTAVPGVTLINKIKAIFYVSGESSRVRIIDRTNGDLVICESAIITSTNQYNIIDLGVISNFPVAQAVWEIQVLPPSSLVRPSISTMECVMIGSL